MTTAIILCYGIFEESNQEYVDYLNWCLLDLEQKQAQKLIICGGYSNNLHPEISEAQSVYSYLKNNLPSSFEVVLEDKSLTTPQNLEFSLPNIDRTGEIYVYCDQARMAKIVWLASKILLNKDRKEISRAILDYIKDRKIKPFHSWNLTIASFDFPSRDKAQYFVQSFTSLIEIEGQYDEDLDQQILSQRKKDFGLS